MTPLAFDDYCYAFVWTDAGNLVVGSPIDDRVDSIADIIHSQWNHYFAWGGRTIAHSLVQFFIWIGKFYFDIVNTLMFAALIFLIVRLAGARLSTKNILWIVFGLWAATPQFMYGMLWLTGACNYLWMSVLQLMFIFLIAQKIFLLIPLGLLAGWSNEAGAIAALFVALYFIVRQKNFSPSTVGGLLSFAIGFALMILAPGNFVRTAHLFPDDFRLTFEILIEHATTFLQILSSEAILLLPLAFAPSTVKKSAPFLIAALLIPSAMMFSPVFKDYAGFASPIYLLIASTAALDSLERLSPVVRPIAVMLSASMLFSLVADYQFDRRLSDQFRLIAAQKNSECVKVPPMEFDPTLEKFLGARVLNHYVDAEFGSHIMGLSPEPNFYYNRAVANYYGLQSIVLEVPR